MAKLVAVCSEPVRRPCKRKPSPIHSKAFEYPDGPPAQSAVRSELLLGQTASPALSNSFDKPVAAMGSAGVASQSWDGWYRNWTENSANSIQSNAFEYPTRQTGSSGHVGPAGYGLYRASPPGGPVTACPSRNDAHQATTQARRHSWTLLRLASLPSIISSAIHAHRLSWVRARSKTGGARWSAWPARSRAFGAHAASGQWLALVLSSPAARPPIAHCCCCPRRSGQ